MIQGLRLQRGKEYLSRNILISNLSPECDIVDPFPVPTSTYCMIFRWCFKYLKAGLI